MTKVITDVAYGARQLQKADIYLPTTANQAAIVFVHGGGWLRGDKAQDADLAKRLAEAGFLVAVPNYRLAPAELFPAAQLDLDAFLAWLAQSDYHFDRAKIGLLGASAGGTMAITASLSKGYPVVAWSPIVDFADWVQKHRGVKASINAQTELGLSDPHEIHDSFYKFFIETYLGDLAPDKLVAVNPTNHLTETLGPTLLFTSKDELAPLTGAIRFTEQAAAFDRDVTLHVVPGTEHARGYTNFAYPETLDFFRRHLLAD